MIKYLIKSEVPNVTKIKFSKIKQTQGKKRKRKTHQKPIVICQCAVDAQHGCREEMEELKNLSCEFL